MYIFKQSCWGFAVYLQDAQQKCIGHVCQCGNGQWYYLSYHPYQKLKEGYGSTPEQAIETAMYSNKYNKYKGGKYGILQEIGN